MLSHTCECIYFQITVQEGQHISASLILFDVVKLTSLEVMLF